MSLAPLLAVPTLAQDLTRVEGALRQSVESSDPFLTSVAAHLIPAGGKRLRPALAITVGGLGREAAGSTAVSDEVVMGACAVELVHLGSLYHDDVMDEAETRRGVESVNARWGNLVAILAGDFLLSKASEIAAELGTEVAGLLAATIGRLCEGQVLELSHTFDQGRTEQAYLTAIRGKTASLMATSCRIGALTSERDRDEVEAVTRFGERFGMVFQIVDDILDLVGTEEQLGKPTGLDLAEGVYTLPVIRALASEATGPGLRPLLGRHIDPESVEAARTIIRSNGSVAVAVDIARGYASEAAEALDALPPGHGVDALRAMAHHLVASVA